MPNWLERVLAAAGLVVLSPLLLVLAAAVWIDSGWPVLFRHRRVGRGGRMFEVVKFRSMVLDHGGPAITRRGEKRITRVGAFLRRWKLDELPQLWNVVRGEMGLVGPRPEAPEYVDLEDPLWRRVLAVRPGITDPASIEYREEEALLAAAQDPEICYRRQILPRKLSLSTQYLERRSFGTDVAVLLKTVGASWLPWRNGSEKA